MTCSNSYTTVTIAGYNSSPPPDDGTTGTDNLLTWAKHKDKLGDPLKTAIEAINTNVNSALDDVVACVNEFHSDVGFSAYAGSNTNLTQNSFTKIGFDTEEFDLGSDFASDTFTAPVAGKYLLIASVRTSPLADGNTVEAAFFVGGSESKQYLDADASKAGGHIHISGSAILDLSASDTVDVRVRVEVTSETANSGQTDTWFQGIRVA